MTTAVISILAFLLAISILVAFHEYGHYWVARRCGVAVLRFSIGFGRPLLRYVSPHTGTEWVLAAWPLGGYVKMVDRRESPNISERLMAYEFSTKPVSQRMAIIAAGPAANLLLAFLIYSLTFMIGDVGRRPLVGYVPDGTPAAVAGLQSGDEVLSIAGEPIVSWQAGVVPLLDAAMNESVIPLEVRRTNGDLAVVTLQAERILENEDMLGTLGLFPLRATSQPIIGQVVEDSPAAAAGLQAGDRVVNLNNRTMETWEGIAEYIRARPGQVMVLEVERDGQRMVKVAQADTVEMSNDAAPVGRLGIVAYEDPELKEYLRVETRYPILQSLGLGLEQTWQMTVLTIQVIGELITGGASLRNISGPVGIAEFAGASALVGLAAFLSMLALLSVSLGVLNLLPVPILDGGGLVFCMVEAVTGKPLSPRVEAIGQRVGLLMLAALMGLALYNDLLRLWQ